MLEMINKVKEMEKENDILLQRLEVVCFSIFPLSCISSVTCSSFFACREYFSPFQLKRENEVLEKTVKMNDETVRSMMF